MLGDVPFQLAGQPAIVVIQEGEDRAAAGRNCRVPTRRPSDAPRIGDQVKALVFQPTQRRAGVVEEIEELIPLPAGLSGADFEILVGLELTADQLEFNRSRSRR